MQIGILDLHNFLLDNGGVAVALQAQSGGDALPPGVEGGVAL